MSVSDSPSDEVKAFRQRLTDIINGRESALDENDDTKLCSAVETPGRRSTATAPKVAQSEPREPLGGVIAGERAPSPPGEFVPLVPGSLPELGVRRADIESIVLKLLLNNGPHRGFEIAKHIRLPLSLANGVLHQLKEDRLLGYKAGAAGGDYVYELSETGIARARRYWEHCTYFGAVPVSVKDYVASVRAQSVRKENPKIREVQKALDGLSIPQEMIIRLAQAVNSALTLFLYGAPGNGKTTIACRLTRAFGETVWIPRALNLGGSIMRVYDPNCHTAEPLATEQGSQSAAIDERWIRIRRPTIVVGGELTLDSFEVRINPTTGVSEAPIQLKSNCGTLVIDDFGRQRATPAEILNRWIIPLDKRYDILHMKDGRTFEFPLDQLIVFSTNLEPRTLVDEAFLRRIPYKIDVEDPSEAEFRALLRKIAGQWGIRHQDGPVDYLMEKYYKTCQRKMRYSHPGDILYQVRTYCNVLNLPLEITNQAVDAAARNYFTLL